MEIENDTGGILLTAINAKYIHSNLAVYALRAYAGKQDVFSNIQMLHQTKIQAP